MKRTVVFMVTNGAGLGHLTRGLAIAKKLKKLDEELEIIFFSTSLATEVIRNEGFMFYYIPTRTLMPDHVSASLWNDYLRKELQQIVDIYDPVAIVFDGAYPYGGIISSLRQYEDIKSIWIKREGYKAHSSRLEQMEDYFDLVIVPKEVGRDYGHEPGETCKRKYCNPIVLLDKNEAHERDVVRSGLQVNPQNRVFYVQLGAGNINEIKEQCNLIINCILKNSQNTVLLGESIIGEQLNIKRKRLKTIRSYPNSQYFKGIDFAVSAVGYNTFHELIYFGVPTLFVPNMNTLKDDQMARAKLIEEKGAALCLEKIDEQEIEDKLRYMCSHSEEIKGKLKQFQKENGSVEAASYILSELNE